MPSTTYRMPTDQELLDYFLLCELGGAGTTRTSPLRTEPAPIRTDAGASPVRAAEAACKAPGTRKEFSMRIGSRTLPRLLAGVAVAGASMVAQAGSFSCIAGTSADCSAAVSNLSWSWDGTDFTLFNHGAGDVSEVYFDLGSGMTASFVGGTGTISFDTGAQPGALPAGGSVSFSSDAAFDSDARGSTSHGIAAGESATFRILAGSNDSIDSGALASGVHVRGLTGGGVSLVSSANVMTPVPEPETIAMLMAGFGMVAWAARSRRKG